MKHRRATAVTLTSRHVLLAEGVAGRDGVRLERLEAIAFDEPLSARTHLDKRLVQISTALRLGAGEGGSRYRDVVLALRQIEAKTRFARLPSNNPDEIAQMARFEIEKTIPFDASGHLSGAVTLRDAGVEGTDVLMFAVEREIVAAAVGGVEHARLGVERTTLSGWGLYSLYRHALRTGDPGATAAAAAVGAAPASAPGAPDPAPEKSPAGAVHLVCNIGMEATNLLLAIDGLPIFLRSSTFGLSRLLAPFEERDLIRLTAAGSPMQVDREEFGSLIRERSASGAASTSGDAERSGTFANLSDDKVLSTWTSRFEQEIRRTVEFAAQTQQIGRLDRIYLGGPGSLVRGFSEHLAKSTNASVFLLDPLAGMAPPAPPAERGRRRTEPAAAAAAINGAAPGPAPAPAPVAAPTAPAAAAPASPVRVPVTPVERALFCETIGILLDELDPAFPPLDLTPEDYRARVARGSRRRSLTATGIIAGVLLVVLFAYFSIRHGMQQDYIEAIRADNRRMAPHAELVAEKEEKLGIVRRHVDDKYSAIAILDMLSSLDVIVQKRARITKFDFRRGEEVIIKGHAKSYADINDFNDALEKQRDFFMRVENRGTEPLQLSAERQVFRFDFLCYLRSIQAQRPSRRSPGVAAGGVTSLGNIP